MSTTPECFARWWTAAVDAGPERPLLVVEPSAAALTCADADALIRRFGAFYQAQGLGVGDRVLVDTGGGELVTPAIFGALAMGMVAVCLPPDAPVALRREAKAAVRLSLFGEDGAGASFGLRSEALMEALEAVEAATALVEVPPEADAVVLFSSGTTGTARGSRISHRALHLGAESFPDMRPWGADGRMLTAAGLHTITGLRLGLPLAALQGVTSVVLPRLTPPSMVWAAARRHGCQVIAGGPGFVGALLRDEQAPPADGTPEVVIVGGGASDVEERRRFARRFNVVVEHTYGLTETCGSNSLWRTTPDGTDGWTPLPGVEVRVDAPEGVLGDVHVHTPAAFTGYLGGGGPNEGWVDTGDVGRFVDGRLEIRGRRARMYTTPGGDKVLIDEVEAALRAATGGLAYVGVVGELRALVERWDADAERDARDRIPARAWPRAVQVLDALPISPNGKVDTAACQAILEQPAREGA